jgi:hypothetical protein
MLGGHPFYQINFPTADESWVYDGSTDLWHRVKSAGIGRHRADTFSNFLNRNYVGDYENGKVYRLRSDVYTDNGDEIALELTGRHVFKDGKTFSIPWLQIEFESGVGLATGQGSNPQVMLQISKDGGHSWGPEIWTSLGKIGRYATRSVWRRLGKARDITFKIRITDPVKRVITNANMQALEGQT